MANYRNTCIATEDTFPSEKLYNFKPKVLLDLLHPKKRYKDFLETSPKKKRIIEDNNSTPTQDPFQNLSPGDKIFYKNNNTHSIEKWIEVQFVKRVSLNVFLISFGRHTANAHRNQLKVVSPKMTYTRIQVPIQRRKRTRERSDSEEDFLGFPDITEKPNQTEDDSRHLKVMRRSPIVTRSFLGSRNKCRSDGPSTSASSV